MFIDRENGGDKLVHGSGGIWQPAQLRAESTVKLCHL